MIRIDKSIVKPSQAFTFGTDVSRKSRAQRLQTRRRAEGASWSTSHKAGLLRKVPRFDRNDRARTKLCTD